MDLHEHVFTVMVGMKNFDDCDYDHEFYLNGLKMEFVKRKWKLHSGILFKENIEI